MGDRISDKVPVMVLFFNRPGTVLRVFESVRKYQPTELFLVQDGAREGRADDVEKIKKCREIVENVDWECNVHKNYADENMSCDYREFTGISWCFESVDKLIILEDDCVPSQSFYKLCEECLTKYENNTEIHSVVGFSRVGDYKSPYDYTFSMTSAGLGWATWKRVWNKVEEIKDLKCLERQEDVDYLDSHIDDNIKSIFGNFKEYMLDEKSKNDESGKIASWEKLVGFTLLANNMLTVTPTKNMVEYIGISDDATHSMSDPRIMPHKVRRVLTRPAYDSLKSIKHPPFIIRDTQFERESKKSMSYPLNLGKWEYYLRRLIFGVLKF